MGGVGVRRPCLSVLGTTTELAVGTLGQSLPSPCLGFLLCRMGLSCTKLVVKSKEAACCESAMQIQVILITAACAKDTQMPINSSPCHSQLGYEERILLNLLATVRMRRTALWHSHSPSESNLIDEMHVWTRCKAAPAEPARGEGVLWQGK